VVLFYFVVLLPPELAQFRGDDGRGESLAHQMLVQARVLGGVDGTWPSAKPLLKRARDEGALVLLSEYLADGFGRGFLVDAPRLQLAQDAEPATSLDVGGGPRVGTRDTGVIQAAGLEEMRDRLIDFGLGVLAIQQACAALDHRQLAAGEKMEGIKVGRHRELRITDRSIVKCQLPNLMISGCTTPPCLAISSRASSEVVAMPCTFSLNSSTLEAQRSASSSVTNPC